ncbi:MAG: ElyC/SanA/YdcF family protein [Patescibacteria group bacterium]
MKRIFLYTALGLALAALWVVAIPALLYIDTSRYIYQDAASSPVAQAALIPGAAILRDGTLSPIFRDRADLAMQLYDAHKVSKILVSGDNSTVIHNEVNPVRKYLLAHGIPEEDIFLDHAGFDTYSTMYRARAIFGLSSVLIASQSFHLPRAVFIGRTLGLEAYGVNADKGHILLRNYFREVLADEKALWDILSHTKPKYLGDTIPITGDGRDYP